jgi:hypothetical protein
VHDWVYLDNKNNETLNRIVITDKESDLIFLLQGEHLIGPPAILNFFIWLERPRDVD